MANKRTYKQLTKKQTASVKRYTKQGKTQSQIAKFLHVSKQRVSTAQAKTGVGKRRPSPFWRDVKNLKGMGYTHKEATEITKYSPKWKKAYKKRTGKARTSVIDKERIRAGLREQYEALTEEERNIKGVEYEGEKYFDTPK